MAAEFAEFHTELRAVAAEMLAKDGAVGWKELADAGWTGLEVAEEHGGAGATFGETAIICEELGHAAATTGYLGGVVLAVGLLNALQPSDGRDALLAGVASGAVRPAVVLDGFALHGNRLSGHADFVPDADGADHLLVVTGGSVVDARLTVTPQPVLDETRRLATVRGSDVEVANVLAFEGDPGSAVQDLADRAAVALSCDSLGISEAMLAATVSYAKVRHQFGRPIGSFQAVKHACADMQVSIAAGRQLVTAAVDAITEGSPEAGVAAAMAKAYATGAAVDIAGKAMQLHGGIGYTWESGIHVYLKRAALNRSLFGSPAVHRKRLARRYLSPT